ncbi:MAG: FHA domain-containing protein [Anaerolineae bacterium]
MDILLLVLRLLLAGLLYAFLGAILLVLWRDLRQATAERQATHPESRLVVLEAPEEAADRLSADTAFRLQPVTSIGRSVSNTVVIPDTYTSSQHALLTWRDGQWWLEDRDSRNGTRLNGNPVQEATLVSSGDVIAVGRTQLKLEVG